jgi:Ca-activated chloride channel family protein
VNRIILPPKILDPQTTEPHDPRGLGALVALVDGAERPFPLVGVRVRAAIAGDACRTVVEQTFRNALGAVMEAVHIFPLPDEGALVEVELRVGDRVIRAECRERADAERVFADARRDGHRAALVTAERADVHTLRVTNLAPGAEVTVRLVVVERLASVDGALRWRFPTVIAPRYLPGNETGHDGPGVLPDTDRVPDASRLEPPLRLAGGTRLDLEVEIAGPIAGVESSLHAVRVDLDGGGVRVAPSAKATLDRDFVLAIRPRTEAAASVRAYTDGSFTLVVVEPPAGPMPALPRDAVFVVDISGSMQGSKVEAAKLALSAALHGLSEGDRFRLVAFDDRVEEFRKDFANYDDASLRDGDRWIAALASRGGTEMLPAIRSALALETPSGRVRTVLFVTDGQAQNETELVAAVAGRRGNARFFTLGIDTAVNSSLLRRLARVGGGTCELAGPQDDVEAVIARLETRFGSPVAEDVRVAGVEAARPEPAVLFTGRPVSFIASGTADRVIVSGRTAVGEFRADAAPVRVEGLGALWARDRVAWFEDRIALRPFEEEAIRPEILRIALAHGIASRFTAFVAVDRTTKAGGAPVEVVQPVELPAEWDEPYAGGMARAACAAPTADLSATGMFAPPPAPVSGGMHSFAAPASARMRRASIGSSGDGIVAKAKRFLRGSAAGGPGEPMAARPAPAVPADPAGDLARSQNADGSFGGDVLRTAAALAALVLLGHTRTSGLRRRTVAKAAAWLANRSESVASAALDLLVAAERGESLDADGVRSLVLAGEEGEALASALAAFERAARP